MHPERQRLHGHRRVPRPRCHGPPTLCSTGARAGFAGEPSTPAVALAQWTCVTPHPRVEWERTPAIVHTMRCMTDPTPYLHLPGTTREALTFYGDVFGCGVQLHTFAEFNRTDGLADAIAHGYLVDGPVALFAADVSGNEPPFRSEGMMLSLLGTAAPPTLRKWFTSLSDGGRVVEDLQPRPWGASDGQVIDRYGLHWLIGFEDEESD